MGEREMDALGILNFLAVTFIFVIGTFLAFLIVVFIRDKLQRSNAVIRNYPVLGHLRGLFTFLGTFFRQYFFAMDREEMPFNRAQRNWVYGASKNEDNTVPFGSTRLLTDANIPLFVNCPYPTLDEDAVSTSEIEVGPYTQHPYRTNSVFNISAMSYGAISKPAVLALSNGARMAGCWMNTGEGGLSPFHLEGGADIVYQIGTAKYGVRDEDGTLSGDKLREVAAHEQVRMFEIKLSQGAKPGKGGILPGEKVTKEIAKIRGIRKGQDSISPNRFPEINNNDELIAFYNHVRDVTGKPVGLKFVVGSTDWVENFAATLAALPPERQPDFLTIDSADGGTGAAPQPLIDYVGLPVSESLPVVVDALDRRGLRPRIRIITSGKMVTPADAALALATGADFINSARGFMFALGCIQALQCNRNTCPTGITTHNKSLQKGLDPKRKAVRVANYAKNMEKGLEIIAHSCGVAEPRCLRRKHVRIVQASGNSIPLSDLHPEVMAQAAAE